MKSSTLISMIALLISIVGLMVALVAYFKRRSCVLCDDLEDDMVEFYEDDDCCGGDCDCHGCGCPEEVPASEASTSIPTDEAAE